jgi:hypothetical protein
MAFATFKVEVMIVGVIPDQRVSPMWEVKSIPKVFVTDKSFFHGHLRPCSFIDIICVLECIGKD